MAATQQRPKLLRRLAWLGAGSLLAVSALGSTAGPVFAAGSIKTTTQDCDDPNPVNENQYETGDAISIHGEGFPASLKGTWQIEGVSGADAGQVVEGPNALAADASGDFCVEEAWIVPPGADGVYKVTVFIGAEGGNEKTDNFTVDEVAQPTPTPTPTPTPNPTPTPGATPTPTPSPTPGGGGAGATLPPTDSVGGSSGGAGNLGLVLMLLAGVLAGAMVLTPARGRRR